MGTSVTTTMDPTTTTETTTSTTTTITTTTTTTTTITTTIITTTTTTTGTCCPEYAHKLWPDCVPFCDLLALLILLGEDTSALLLADYDAFTPARAIRRLREVLDEEQEEEAILDQIYLAYIDLEECTTLDRCHPILGVGQVVQGLIHSLEKLKTMEEKSPHFLRKLQT